VWKKKQANDAGQEQYYRVGIVLRRLTERRMLANTPELAPLRSEKDSQSKEKNLTRSATTDTGRFQTLQGVRLACRACGPLCGQRPPSCRTAYDSSRWRATLRLLGFLGGTCHIELPTCEVTRTRQSMNMPVVFTARAGGRGGQGHRHHHLDESEMKT